MNANKDSGRIVILYSLSQFTFQFERPTTKWDSKSFSATGDMVAGTFTLVNWEPRYLNLLRHLENVPIPAIINTDLETTPPPTLLDSVADRGGGTTAVRVYFTVYLPPLFVLILLAGKLIPVKA